MFLFDWLFHRRKKTAPRPRRHWADDNMGSTGYYDGSIILSPINPLNPFNPLVPDEVEQSAPVVCQPAADAPDVDAASCAPSAPSPSYEPPAPSYDPPASSYSPSYDSGSSSSSFDSGSSSSSSSGC